GDVRRWIDADVEALLCQRWRRRRCREHHRRSQSVLDQTLHNYSSSRVLRVQVRRINAGKVSKVPTRKRKRRCWWWRRRRSARTRLSFLNLLTPILWCRLVSRKPDKSALFAHLSRECSDRQIYWRGVGWLRRVGGRWGSSLGE